MCAPSHVGAALARRARPRNHASSTCARVAEGEPDNVPGTTAMHGTTRHDEMRHARERANERANMPPLGMTRHELTNTETDNAQE